MTSTSTQGQLTLPGQAAAPDGPVDLTPMFLMHHAFRRDLGNFAGAVRGTPVADRATWQALDQRWQRFATILHHHHSGEDRFIWPELVAAVEKGGSPEDLATLEAMEAEHGEIDPMLEACARGFATLAERADEAAHAALVADLTRTRERLGAHLGHEERDALALVQRFLTPADWARIDKQVGAGYPAKLIPFTLAWVMHDLPAEGRTAAAAFLGRPAHTLWSLAFRRPFERKERAAFRYATAG
ncbi:hemerythrin domain-containing protein [Blastococcus litoris]|uniref:hemerythrin domain-containing protein n=1 Tax=Blastococcus litoris TaxID=2171622 RepID=UPI000E306D63|nr:hemerythrin domain-containing protein [Blastococcus litoris]